jgi:hypothetical protein
VALEGVGFGCGRAGVHRAGDRVAVGEEDVGEVAALDGG